MKPAVVLCDRSDDVVAAWRHQFREIPEVEVLQGDLFEAPGDVLVLPANAFGFLDRGLELQVCERYGFEVQDGLRETIRGRFHGELLTGQAVLMPLSQGAAFRHLLYVAMTRAPGNLGGSLAAYLAARGAFLLLRSGEAPAASRIVFPGIGTGEAGLHPLTSARQLRYAYEVYWTGTRGYGDKNLTQAARRERKLRSLPASGLEELGSP